MPARADPVLERFVSRAFQRFDAKLDAALPRSQPKLRELLRRVPTRPEHIVYARGFPHVVLPYWLSPEGERSTDSEFQTDVIYSSINGYYSIRLCDNIADNDCPPKLRKLAPFVLYFDNEAIRPYMKHFPVDHEFWNFLDRFLAQQADASAADSFLDEVDADLFDTLSSKKFSGAKIPIAAVHFRYPKMAESLEQWLLFVDRLGSLAQFSNDFFDWKHDAEHGIITYFTSEAKRRAPTDSLTTWFFEEGFDWGVAELKTRFENVNLLAEALGNESVLHWLKQSGLALNEDIDKVRSGVQLFRSIGSISSNLAR